MAARPVVETGDSRKRTTRARSLSVRALCRTATAVPTDRGA